MAKIVDYGKMQTVARRQARERREAKASELAAGGTSQQKALKTVRLGVRASDHDLDTRQFVADAARARGCCRELTGLV